MKRVAGWITAVIELVEDEGKLSRIRAVIREFCSDYPVPGVGST